MYVVKRSGNQEPVSFDKITNRIRKLCDGLNSEYIDPAIITAKVASGIYNGITTRELDKLAAETAAYSSTFHPDWSILAARIAVSDLHKNTTNDFAKNIQSMCDYIHPVTGKPAPLIATYINQVIQKHANVLNQAIQYERDYDFDFFGFKTLEKTYLLRMYGNVAERPQQMYMRVAVAIHTTFMYHDNTPLITENTDMFGEESEKRLNELKCKYAVLNVERAIETYNLMSQRYFTHATPTLFNAGTVRPQLSSCFLLQIPEDSIESIYDTLKKCAMISKYAGGIGLSIHSIRASDSYIAGTNGVSNGIVPMLRVYNDTARYVDQCFTPETLIFTESGHKQIQYVNTEDKVLSDDGNYYAVDKLVPHDYSGKVLKIQIKNSTFSVRVTSEHQVLALKGMGIDESFDVITNRLDSNLSSIDYVDAKDLEINDFVVFPKNADISVNEFDLRYQNYILSRIETIEELDYTGKVYDFEINTSHNYTVSHLGIVHNGGGRRKGSIAVYLEPWHADIYDFLELRKNSGKEEMRARDLFYGLWVPDLFMKRVEENGDWTLFCPNEAPGLSDAHSEDFEKLYLKYESEGLGRKVVKAQSLWFHILQSQIETGTPYLLYKDAANFKSNQKNLGTIKSSNLCVAPETLVLTDQGQIPIKDLKDQEVNVWNGNKWSKTTVRQTGENQSVLGVEILVGSIDDGGDYSFLIHHIQCTPYHKFILESDEKLANAPRKEAKDLKRGDCLFEWTNEKGEISEAIVWGVYDYGRTCDTYCFNEPENHAGVFNGILTGNCSEIIEYTAKDEIAVCNLASIALNRYVDVKTKTFDFEKLMEVTRTIVYNLNNVIDTNFYPDIETFKSNMRHRPIGIGVQGLADTFALMRYPFESLEASRLNSEIFACIYYAALEASSELAMMDGAYSSFVGSPANLGLLQFDLWKTQPLSEFYGKTKIELKWDSLKQQIDAYGLRNSLLLAPMPTASTAQILGNNESIEPFTSNIYSRKVLSGEFPIVNKHLLRDLIERGLWNSRTRMQLLSHKGSIQNIPEIPEDLKELYKTVWEIKQKTLIDLSADRGIYVCQSQSLNLFVAEPTISKLSSMHFYTWKKGLKTGIYYLRTQPKADAIQFTVDLSGPIDDFKTKKGVTEENRFKTREARAAAERAAIRAAIARGEYEDDESVCINCSG